MNFNLNLKKADINLAVRWSFGFSLLRFFKRLFFVLFVVVSSVFLYDIYFFSRTSDVLLGLSIISLVVFIFSLIKEGFFNSKLKKPEIKTLLSEAVENPGQYNLAEFLSFEVAGAVSQSLKFVPSQGVNSSHLFYFLLEGNPKLNFIFSRALLDLKGIKKELRSYLNEKRHLSTPGTGLSSHQSAKGGSGSGGYSEDFQDTILEAFRTAQKKKHQRVEIGDFLTALAKCNQIFKRILIDSELKVEDIENLTWWLEDIEKRREEKKKFWKYENLAKRGTLAKGWIAAYSINLDKYSKDLTDVVRVKSLEFVGHEKELEVMERILSRREINNVLMIGQPGTGKKSIVMALAKKSLAGQALPGLNYKKVKELDMSSLLAEVKGIDEAEVVLGDVFREAASAGNIILVIDKFHNYIGQRTRPGIIDISGVIAPYLRSPHFQIVAITTYDGLHRYIERNPFILSLFEKVEVSQIAPRETLILLENLTFVLEKKYKKLVSYPALREIVSLTERYMPSLAFPEKAIEILDEVVIYVASSTSDKTVLPKHVARVITEKTEIPVGEIETKERKVLLNLEELIHQRIINQDEAVREVSTAMRRARSEITVRKGPIGAFLFLGPTGVGKTETSKALAEVYFGSEKRMIRMDMSEFQNSKDIDRLIGSNEEKGLLTTAVREDPFSLVLLDEIEKAHPNILNLFLQVLDEGHLTDGLGRKVDFRNTIIIATSNAGYKVILQVLKELTPSGPLPANKPVAISQLAWAAVKKRLLDYLFANRIFRPELINRFDAFVVFRPLSKQNLLDIAELMFQKLKKNLKEKGIELVITKALKEKIVELSYSPVFGARQMRRVIQDKVENVLAEALLKSQIKRGDRVEMNSEFKLIIN